MPLGAGSTINANVRLERELGRGAMGSVWLAHHQTLDTHVAVKILHAAFDDCGEAFHRFQQEAQGAARLDSPHVVKVFDFGVTAEGEPFIVMELLRGRDLREHLAHHGRLAPGTVADLVRQLCRGLGQAHERGLIHRDIKPANVFLLEPDRQPFVKVLDFGIAKALGADLEMTTTGTLMGTPYYMSPEQLIDPRTIDGRSDLWSVAVIAYGSMLGQLPFMGATIGALSIAVHEGRFPRPSELDPALPPALDAFFTRALAVAPQDRYPTAEALAHAFAAATQGAPSTAGTVAPQLTGAPATAYPGTFPSMADPRGHGGSPTGGYVTAPSSGPFIPPASAGHAAHHQHPPSASAPSLAQSPATYPDAPPPIPPHAPAPTPGGMVQTAPPAEKRGGGWWKALLAILLLGGAVAAGAFLGPQLLEDERTAKRSRDDDDDGDSAKSDGDDEDEVDDAEEETEEAADDEPPRPRPTSPKPTTTTPKPTEKPTPKTVSDPSLAPKLVSCWTMTEGKTAGEASSVTVSMPMPERGTTPKGVAVSGPAAKFGGFRDCVMRNASAHARLSYGDAQAGKTVVASAALPECVWDKAAQKHRCGGS